MAGYYRKINAKYIAEFKNNVRKGIDALVRTTDSMVLKVILTQVNYLFRIMSGRLSSKRQIPTGRDYPDSTSYNEMLDNISIDIDKVYTAQSLIESDVQNVANFNSLEREKAIKNLTRTQRKVYTEYIKSKKNISGTTIIREDFKTDKIPSESSDVQINLIKENLTLKVENVNETRSFIDKTIVDCYYVDQPESKYNIYPNNVALAAGSFWKLERGYDTHFTLKDYNTRYKNMMVDGNSADNLGSTQFESVFTYNEDSGMRQAVEEELGNYFQLHPSFIMVDFANSMYGSKYSSTEDIETSKIKESINPKVKLVIPFKNNSPLASSFIADFEPNDGGVLPSINVDESFAYDVRNNKVKFQSIIESKIDNYDRTGRYQINFQEPIIPTRIELILSYATSPWPIIEEYMMTEYIFEKRKTFELQTSLGSSITTTLVKIAYVFVDTESVKSKELIRANNVMKLTGVEK